MIVDKQKETLDNFFRFCYEKTFGVWAGVNEEKEVKANLTYGSNS